MGCQMRGYVHFTPPLFEDTAVLIGVLAISNSMNTAGMQPDCDCLFVQSIVFFKDTRYNKSCVFWANYF